MHVTLTSFSPGSSAGSASALADGWVPCQFQRGLLFLAKVTPRRANHHPQVTARGCSLLNSCQRLGKREPWRRRELRRVARRHAAVWTEWIDRAHSQRELPKTAQRRTGHGAISALERVGSPQRLAAERAERADVLRITSAHAGDVTQQWVRLSPRIAVGRQWSPRLRRHQLARPGVPGIVGLLSAARCGHLLPDLTSDLLRRLRGLLANLLRRLQCRLVRGLMRHLLRCLRSLQSRLLCRQHTDLLSTLQRYLLCTLLPNLLRRLCCLERRLLGRLRRLTCHLVCGLLRRHLRRLIRGLLACHLADLCRLLRDLLRRRLRNSKRNRGRDLAADPAQHWAKLRQADVPEAHSDGLRYGSARAAKPTRLAKAQPQRLTQLWNLNPSCQRIEVSVLDPQHAASLRIAQRAAEAHAERLTELAKNVSEPTRRHILRCRSVIRRRTSMSIWNLVRIT